MTPDVERVGSMNAIVAYELRKKVRSSSYSAATAFSWRLPAASLWYGYTCQAHRCHQMRQDPMKTLLLLSSRAVSEAQHVPATC